EDAASFEVEQLGVAVPLRRDGVRLFQRQVRVEGTHAVRQGGAHGGRFPFPTGWVNRAGPAIPGLKTGVIMRGGRAATTRVLLAGRSASAFPPLCASFPRRGSLRPDGTLTNLTSLRFARVPPTSGDSP